MKNADSHLLLYAKHHYQTGDLWDDLAKILAERNALSVEYLNKRLIFENIVHITLDYIKVDARVMADLILELQPAAFWKWSNDISFAVDPEDYDFYYAAVRKCLSLLAITRVYGDDGEVLIVLDEPDPNILPISKLSKFNKENESDEEPTGNCD